MNPFNSITAQYSSVSCNQSRWQLTILILVMFGITNVYSWSNSRYFDLKRKVSVKTTTKATTTTTTTTTPSTVCLFATVERTQQYGNNKNNNKNNNNKDPPSFASKEIKIVTALPTSYENSEYYNDDINDVDDDDYEDEDEVDEEEEEEPILKIRNGNAQVNNNNNQRQQSNGVRRKSKSKKNAAMQDPQFLRKRTSDILKITDEWLGSNNNFDDECNIVAENNQQTLLGRQMKVDKKTFHFLLDAWAFSTEEDAPEQAKLLLQRMEELGRCSNNIQPDVRSYTKTINAIARHATTTAGEEAEQILEKLQSNYYNQRQSNNNSHEDVSTLLKPNVYTYTAVIQAHCQSGVPGSAERAEQLLNIMIDRYQRGDNDCTPMSKTFNSIICAYGKIGQASNAQTIFNRMKQLYESGMEQAKPNTYHYNSLISAWANNNSDDRDRSAARAEEVLDEMERLFYETHDKDVKPTTVSFNAVIDAFAKSGEIDAAPKAEEIFKHMQGIQTKPNTRSYNSVINAWAKSPNPDAAVNAEVWLDTMEQQYEDGDTTVRPDAHSFCTVINAHARSNKPDKAVRAYKLYKEMGKLYKAGNKYVRPNVVAANAVINACAYTTGDMKYQNQAVEIAHAVLKDLEQSPHGTPDQVTYGTFMKVCANQMPDSHTRQQIVEVLFKKCRKDGQVGNLVLQQFRNLATPELYEEMIGKSITNDNIQMEDLPKEWWCNVVEGKWQRRKLNK